MLGVVDRSEVPRLHNPDIKFFIVETARLRVTFLREAVFIQVWLNQVIHSDVNYKIHDIT